VTDHLRQLILADFYTLESLCLTAPTPIFKIADLGAIMARTSPNDQDWPRKRAKHHVPNSVEQQAPQFAKVPPPILPKSPSRKTNIPILPKDTPENISKSEAEHVSALSPPGSLLPAHLDYLKTHYSIATMSIISSSKIETKVKTLLKHLERFSFGKIDAKPGVVALYAKGAVANKLVSVIEIAKRTVAGQKGKIYQYAQLKPHPMERTSSQDAVNEVKGDGKKSGKNETVEQEDGSDSEDADYEPAFETTGTPGRTELYDAPLHAVPMLTVFLSRVPVHELAAEYGYVFARRFLGSMLIWSRQQAD
jgi:Alba